MAILIKGIETMLRMSLMQIWFNLSGAAIEDAIYDSYAMPSFMCIDLNQEYAPDSTTLLKFRCFYASDQERKAVVLWNEDSCRGRCRWRLCSCHYSDNRKYS